VPWLRQVMGFAIPPVTAFGVVAAILLSAVAWMEVLRLVRLQYMRRRVKQST
jgi:hypothetical protein